MWAEAVEQTANMMAMSPYPGFQGKFFSMPVRNVVPKPLQKPHPPIWVACSKPRDHPCRGARRHRRAHLRLRRSGRGRQVGARILRHHQERRVRADRPHGERQHRHGDRLLAATRTRAEARRRGSEGFQFFGYSLGHYYVYGHHQPGIDRHLGALRGGQGQAAAGRAGQRHRHAGRADRSICAQLSGRRRRSGGVHPAGRSQQARAHLRVAEAFRRQGHAGAQGRPGGARCEEAGRAGALHRGRAQAQEADGAGARRRRRADGLGLWPHRRAGRPGRPKVRRTTSPPTSR